MNMSKTITTLLLLAVLIVGGFWLAGRSGDLARDNNGAAATTTEDLTGVGGPEDGYDPLQELNSTDGNGNGVNYDEDSKG